MIADDVDQQAVALEVARHPAQALEVGADLRDTLRRAGVERLESLRPQHAVGLQAVRGLEALDRLDQGLVVVRLVARIEDALARGGQAGAQRGHARAARTGLERRPGGDPWPVAAGEQSLLSEQLGAQRAVERQIGRLRLHRRGEVGRLQHAREFARTLVGVGRRSEVPLAVERVRIDLAVTELEEQRGQGVGE